ncbi:hypothetical protein BDY17DRAFT_294437 [Neohortaea acidophila]|uniref:GA4 desaturase n=1 Tax=Neohortaea acidophila TaxID=245834 RepID=A0A6A6Q1L8_9PEZI|nr:uncharacterized protein BDY17DRAFT_294437 [Neohortaea acidophila]KAF2485884.1 hypothetical protein BDY17DRAFT_294437 [Neohortaea acidophila]
MGSLKPPRLYGVFTYPISDGDASADLTKDEPESKINVKCPLVDFRDQVFQSSSHGDYKAEAAFMKTHGFTAVKHVSAITDSNVFHDPPTVQSIYHPEVVELVKQVTGCKTVVVINSNCRGEISPHEPKVVIADSAQQIEEARHWPMMSPPLRAPHSDYAALGGRQAVRSEVPGLRAAAEAAGIIAREDAICGAAGVPVDERAGKKALEKDYNGHANGKLGPRYAAFSIWKPLKPVTRDPLALLPWSSVQQVGDLKTEYYDNRFLKNKMAWIKEYATVEVRPDAVERIGNGSSDANQLEWYYISDMQPDEVLFAKLFDTAGLGNGAAEEVGSFHASPDLGDAAYGDVRQSIEVRCMAFW